MSMSGKESGGTDWRIGEVTTELTVTDAVGSLSPEDVKKLVRLVLQHLREDKYRAAQLERDTAVSDRAYQSDVE